MKTELRTILPVAILCLYTLTFVGCTKESSSTASAPPTSGQEDGHDHDDDDHDHDDHEGHDQDDHEHDDHDHQGHDQDDHEHADHDHDDHDHEGHDHPAHGPNGGHMVNLSGGAHAEWAHEDEKDLLTVYAEKPEAVTKVTMKTTIEGNETIYEFEKQQLDGKTVYQLVSPELLTAVKMGKGVDTKLLISTEAGESTGQVEHHAH
jgi:hypothetical protein